MMGEMAEVNRITRTSSVQSQLSVDAEPVTPRPTRELETCNFYSNDLSQDAIAGVPPRNMRQLAPFARRGPPIPEGSSFYSMLQPQDTEQHVKRSLGSSIQQGDISVRDSRPRQGLEEKSIKRLEDDDSSYGSFSLSSIESCSSMPSDWETELQTYKDKMPAEIRVGYYDVVILYTENDREDAETFRQHLINDIKLPKNETVLALLYDSHELTGLSGSQIQHLNHAMERCTYVFVYLTAEFVEDKWCEFSSESCLMKAIYDPDKRWCVVPVYTERRGDCKFKIPMGLNSLKGINYYCNDEFYKKGVARLISDKIVERINANEQHKIKQKEWLESYKRDQIKLEEQKRRIAKQQEQMSQLYKAKVQKLPDSELFENKHANMHNSFSESHLSNKEYGLPHSASLGSIKSIKQQDPNVARYLQDYKDNFRYTTQRSYTQEEVEFLTRLLQLESESPPDPVSGKFQRLNIRSQTSSCSADMGVHSETTEQQEEAEVNFTPEMYAYFQTLTQEGQQNYLDSIHIQQLQKKEQQNSLNFPRSAGDASLQDRLQSYRNFPRSAGDASLEDSRQSYRNFPRFVGEASLEDHQQSYMNQIGGHKIPNFDKLSINSQEPSLVYSHQSGASADSSGSYTGGSSWTAGPDTSMPSQQMVSEQDIGGNFPSALVEDGMSMMSEDCMHLSGTGRDQRIVERETKVWKQSKVSKDREAEEEEFSEEDEPDTTKKKGNVVQHIHKYYIMNPKAVQIGNENVIQDQDGNKVEADSEPGTVTETKMKVKNQKSGMEERLQGDETEIEDKKDSPDGQRKSSQDSLADHIQIHGEMPDSPHNSGMVAMDAALSSAGSCAPLNANLPQVLDKCKGELPAFEKTVSSGPAIRQNLEPAVVGYVNGSAKPKIPAKPSLNRDNIQDEPKILVKPVVQTKPLADLEQFPVKSQKVVLPVRDSTGTDDVNESEKSPSVVRQVFSRPMAKIGPCIVKNNNECENTEPKLIAGEQTCLKQPYCRNNISEETQPKTFAWSGANAHSDDETFLKTPYAGSEQTQIMSDVEKPRQMSIQDFMPIGALERSGCSVESEEKKETSQGDRSFQAPPFSVARHPEVSTLFYVNRFDKLEATEVPQDGLDSVDQTETSYSSFNLQEVPPGEDPLSKPQETLGFIPENLDDEDLEYDMLEDSLNDAKKITTSTESQKTSPSKLTRFIASIKNKLS